MTNNLKVEIRNNCKPFRFNANVLVRQVKLQRATYTYAINSNNDNKIYDMQEYFGSLMIISVKF